MAVNKKQDIEEDANLSIPINFPIVGIGTSAGGLAALEEFFSGIPVTVDTDIAFVIVQHLAPHHKSILTELVQRFTHMNVFEVEEGTVVKPNSIYIIPPNKNMIFSNGMLQLTTPTLPHGQRLPIDFFFRSLAVDQKEKAICIVLSGNGNDGMFGVRAIKNEGGMAMAQSPETTEYDSMPLNAIATGLIDYVFSPAELYPELIKYIKHSIGKLPRNIPSIISVNVLAEIHAILKAQTGQDFSDYKQNTINRRIERRMAVHHFDTIEKYYSYLQDNRNEVQMLYKDLLIGVTNFFRDTEAFQVLENSIIPKLFSNKLDNSTIRIWSTGCSTGEEAYSIAILLQEHLEKIKHHYKIQIFATDIDSKAIANARMGVYSSNIAMDVSPERLGRFFIFDETNAIYRISKQIRDMVVFSEQNVIKDPPFSKIDLIACRNLLIYLNSDLQKRIIPLFHYALNSKGLLFLGNSESIGDYSNLFSIEDRKAKIFRKKEVFQNKDQALYGSFYPFSARMDNILGSQMEKSNKQIKIPFKELTEKALLEQISPDGALINAAGDILYIYGRFGVYLELTAGETGVMNIIKMAREGLKHELMIALNKSLSNRESVFRSVVRISIEGKSKIFNLTIRPVLIEISQNYPSPLSIVILDEVESSQQSDIINPLLNEPSKEINEYITQLRQELKTKEEFLQNLNEELETSNEELKSSNEEMQSVNEELQSSNEELETSKEEMQSVNEELSTINSELQAKVTDLSRANNDMNNLLSGTGIATIFVDYSLRILRFTPTATKIINLIPTDFNRPISHVVTNFLDYNSLVEDTQEVLNTLIHKQLEVQITDNKWYTMRIQPYRTLENVIEGAVITFSDITERKFAEKKVNELLEKNEVLLREVHHRIKNHMNGIYSLLSLQSGSSKEPLVSMALRDAANRVQSMIVLYDQLNQSEGIEKVSGLKYLTKLVDQIFANSETLSTVKVEKDFKDFHLDVNRMQSLGLIVNELITNSLKYAFKDTNEGLIKITSKIENNTAYVNVEDNGKGLPDSVDFENSTGLGLKLVKMLSKHLGGTIEMERGIGVKYRIEFQVEESKNKK